MIHFIARKIHFIARNLKTTLLLSSLAACGIVMPAQAFTTLHAFRSGADGALPYGSVIMDGAGNLWGTTAFGGNGGACNGHGCGVVYEFTAAGTEAIWESFNNDGRNPVAGVLMDSKGNVYCTTLNAGIGGAGTLFEVMPNGKEKVLYSFTGAGDGGKPRSNLVMDSSGNLYGTTSTGGVEAGTIFKLAKDGTETTVHSFFDTDGFSPEAGLLADSAGNFYGTTSGGGTNGIGTVFRLAPDGTYTVLYAFGTNSPDGVSPFAGVAMDSSGNLYGTTKFGGGNSGCGGSGCGAVFKLTPGGTETLLHSFAGGSDGATPLGSVVLDSNGNVYGTTAAGGGTGCGGPGCGIVFKLTPSGTETILHSFTGGNDGGTPLAGLFLSGGYLYGTTSNFGAHNFGTLFKLKD